MSKQCYPLLWIAPLAIALSLAAQASLTTKGADWTADQLSMPFPPASSEQQLIEILRSSAPEKKVIACKQLAIYGSKAAVPELAKLLANAEIASWSRIALEAIPDPSADAALVQAAKTLQGRLLVGTINSIGVRRSVGAVDHLTVRLKDTDADVAAAAAVALGRIGNDAATKVLRRSLAVAAPAVRSAVAEGCILCAERLMAEGKQGEAAAIYDEVRRADVPKQRVLEATRGAIVARGAQGIPLLVEQLKSLDKGQFQIGLGTARELPGREVAEALAAELVRMSPERASLVVYALADRDEAELPPAVLKAASEGDTQVRLAAIDVVGRLGDTSCVPALLEIAADRDAQLSQAAKLALANLPGEQVDADLANRLSVANDKSKVVLIKVIGARRIDATAELVKLLDHPDEVIRNAALTSLGATAGPEDLAVLISAFTDAKNRADVAVAERALVAASIRMPDREATAAQLAAAMARVSMATQASLLRILGAMGGPTALETIAGAVNGGDDELQDTGTRVLGEWITPDAAPHLFKIAASDHKYKVRALRGYLRIARQLNLPPEERLKMATEALKIAQRPDERKLVLDVLTRCPSPAAIDLAKTLLDDDAVRPKAAETIVVIAERIKDKDPTTASAAAKQALAAGLADGFTQRAQALVKAN
jgi:HEAT repeat protein